MSDLRFFADQMHELIEKEKKIKKILSTVYTTKKAYEEIAKNGVPFHTDRMSYGMAEAREGICAMNIILRAAL